MPAERPILMSAPMVKALLAGTKVQTRRIVKPPLHPLTEGFVTRSDGFAPIVAGYELGELPVERVRRCPYGRPGGLLWVRETWMVFDHDFGGMERGVEEPTAWFIEYRAGGDAVGNPPKERRAELAKYYGTACTTGGPDPRWRPSIHMPKWAARLWLEIVAVRCERLQEISEEDAKAEGVRGLRDLLLSPRGADAWAKYTIRAAEAQGRPRPRTSDSVGAFAYLWDRLNKKRAPWSSNPWVWVLTFRRTEAPQKEAA